MNRICLVLDTNQKRIVFFKLSSKIVQGDATAGQDKAVESLTLRVRLIQIMWVRYQETR